MTLKKTPELRPSDRPALLNLRGGVMVGAFLAALVIPPLATSADSDSRTATQKCGASGSNVPTEVVNLQSGKNIWLEFPAMRRAPVLESDDAPATLVIFTSGYDLAQVGMGNGTPPPATAVGTVLCVIQEDGRVSLFTNVPTAGSRIAP
jgi:hypothetical protein